MKLSNDMKAIEVHERATSYYRASEKFAYKFLMDLKTIRDEKLYKALGFQDFEAYTLQNFGYTRETITNRIQSAEVWGSNYDEALRHFGKTKTRQLGIMPEKDRQKVLDDGIPTSEGIKSIDQATTREIESYKRKLKEKDSQLEQAKKSEQIAIDKLEEEQNKEPEVIEKEVIKEIKPHDYDGLKSDNQQLEFSNRRLRKQMQEMEERQSELLEQQKGMDEKSKKYDELNEAIREMQGKMDEGQKSIKAQKDVYDLVRKANELIVEVAPLTYLIDTENIVDNEYARKPIEKIISNLRDMADRLDTSINQQIYEGEIVNE